MKIAAFSLLLTSSLLAAEHASSPFFKILDRSGDGEIQPGEVDQSPWLTRLDSDANGAVSAAEFSAGWDHHPALRAGLARRFPEAIGYTAPKPSASNTAQASPRQGVRLLTTAESGIGRMIADLEVPRLDGKPG